MEKQTFHEKLLELKPIVKEYFGAKKIAETPEIKYVSDRCKASEPKLEEDKLGEYNEKSLLSTQKIFRIALGVAIGWGALCIIIGIAGPSAMDIVLGLCICVGTFFLYRHFDGKLKEKLCISRERTKLKNEYKALVEKTKAERRAVVETVDAKHEKMKAKFEELGLSSLLFYRWAYQFQSLALLLRKPLRRRHIYRN